MRRSATKWRYLAIWLLAFGLFLIITAPVEGHHTGVECGPDNRPGRAVCLPYADNSFAVKTLQQTRQLTFCFNSRARNYPSFVAQVRDVNAFQGAALGITWTEIAGTYDDSPSSTGSQKAKAVGCQVLHSMPENHGCSGCGAWVHYLNNPVLIEYRWQAGYTDWRTTIAHEQTHIYGLHEHYNDGAGISCFRPVFGRWAHGLNSDPGSAGNAPTVMDCGVGIYLGGQWLTEYDVIHVCQNVDPTRAIFVGCGMQQPPPVDVIYFPDGWGYRFSDQHWINPDGWPEWQPCNIYGERFNYHLNVVMLPGSVFYSRHFWSSAGAC